MKELDASNKSILNLCGGKINPLCYDDSIKDCFLINLDKNYLIEDSLVHIREEHNIFQTNIKFNIQNRYHRRNYINYNVYDFLERYDINFDIICIYRFLEHVSKTNILYFIYLLSTCTKPGAILDIIVPDYKILAKRILEENVYSSDFESDDIITTYELLNDPENPHVSIWTRDRINKFFTLENRFKIDYIKENYEFDGRNIYLRTIIERI